MQALDPLSSELNIRLSDEGKATILSAIWNTTLETPKHSGEPSRLNTYFRYYEDQCRQYWGQCTNSGLPVCTKTHRDVVKLIQLMLLAMNGSASSKLDLIEAFRSSLPADNPARCDQLFPDTLDFGARLLLMMDIGPDRPGYRRINQTPIKWEDGGLSAVIIGQLNTVKELSIPVRLERTFTAPNLELIANIKIVWVDNLADHLRMSDDDAQVAIYSHVQFLKLDQGRNQYDIHTLFPFLLG